MPARPRPTSPHVWLYRWQMGNTLSILHRFTGAALTIGLLGLVCWLMALASGEQVYGSAMTLLTSPPGRVALIGWTFAFLYHLLNGIRHLFWDIGMGFERTPRHASGWFAVGGAVLLTVIVWMFNWRFA